jgi:hypothetical protein
MDEKGLGILAQAFKSFSYHSISAKEQQPQFSSRQRLKLIMEISGCFKARMAMSGYFDSQMDDSILY